MKKLKISGKLLLGLIAVFVFINCQALVAEQPGKTVGEMKIPRGEYLKQFNIKEPWLSKGLTRVEITYQDKTPPLVICQDGKPAVDIVVSTSSEPAYYKEVAGFLKAFLDLAVGGGEHFQILYDSPGTRKAIFIGPCKNKAANNIFLKK